MVHVETEYSESHANIISAAMNVCGEIYDASPD
jgi:hypothetical protein